MAAAQTDNGKAGQNGIILLDKPLGISSARAVARLRRCYSGVRAGHGGSLDPLASGVLPVFLGHATRFASYSLSARKSYQAGIRLGLRTDTDDLEGQPIESFAGEAPDAGRLQAIVASLRGETEQTPPQFSAIKIGGVRAYRLARQGQQADIQPRKVHIYRLEILEYAYPRLAIEVDCSKGTYIRSLARDIGDALGVGGTIERLRRTAVSGFDCRKIHTLDEIEQSSADPDALGEFLLPADACLGHLAKICLDSAQIQSLYHGISAHLSPEQAEAGAEAGESPGQPRRIYGEQGVFYGLARVTEGPRAKSVRLIPAQFPGSSP